MALVPVDHRFGLPEDRDVAFAEPAHGGGAQIAEMSEAGKRAFVGGIARGADVDGEIGGVAIKPQKNDRRIGRHQRFRKPRLQPSRFE